jgi:hypothetical protein
VGQGTGLTRLEIHTQNGDLYNMSIHESYKDYKTGERKEPSSFGPAS